MIDITIDLSAQENPDKNAIASKQVIDVSLSMTDISASLSSGSLNLSGIKTNYMKQKLIIVTDAAEQNNEGNIYYTPTYTEQINYEVWKTTVNKTFNELGLA
jgi:hypothetical protein